MSEWNDISDTSTVEVSEITEDIGETVWDMEEKPEKLAADYVRSFEGFDKAARYVERHFDGDSYTPGDVIPVSTRNQGLEGAEDLEGVRFTRQDICLTDGLTVRGVFPRFDSIFDIELGPEANDLTPRQQRLRCKEEFLDHMYDDPSILQDVTIGDMERLEKPNGYAPEGYDIQHNGPVGSMSVVRSDLHRKYAHTGSNAISGKE